MASPSYSEDLNCPLCLTLFNSPVVLPCGHSFCSLCITEALRARQQCPMCSFTVAAEEAKCLPANLILKSLVEKAQQGDQTAKAAGMCPEHEEKFKLFCLTDLQLACIICRDGEKHEGHKFKPIKEAAQSLRSDLETILQRAAEDINATEQLTKAQEENIRESREKSKQLMGQISQQFQEMHQFLRKREDEIKNELKCQEADAVDEMKKALATMETSLSETKELESKAASALKITDPEKFVRTWTEGRSPITQESLFRSRASTLQVVNRALSLEQYESHLQLFMWKEMLQVISPREQRLTLKSSSPNVAVSDDGRSVFCVGTLNQPQAQSFAFVYSSPAFATTNNTSFFGNIPASPSKYSTLSTTEFLSGQQYWEINVGNRDFWEVGINNNFLQYKQGKYAACYPNRTQELVLENKPQKIGIYLNLSSNKLIFFNADNMRKLHSMSLPVMSEPVSACISMAHRNPDYSPLTVCWF